jgi:hypothetical protein
MSNLSQQVQELEQRLESLEYENENLKIMLYRMIASNGRLIEPIPYSETKGKLINQIEFSPSLDFAKVVCKFNGTYNLTPNNTPDEL